MAWDVYLRTEKGDGGILVIALALDGNGLRRDGHVPSGQS